MAQALLIWLERRGSANSLAVVLGVHPQTVRYRQRQLKELFGSALDDPETAFAISSCP
jgi:DNA-binding PucR family transcriptional regulator